VPPSSTEPTARALEPESRKVSKKTLQRAPDIGGLVIATFVLLKHYKFEPVKVFLGALVLVIAVQAIKHARANPNDRL
jgi:hypothetical protein